MSIEWTLALVSGIELTNDAAKKINHDNPKLNEIRIGDYIEKSELDTEQKYNDVVEVFGLFDFEPFPESSGYAGMLSKWDGLVVDNFGEVTASSLSHDGCKRKLTYNQIMAIGKLKRMMNDKSKVYIEDITDEANAEYKELVTEPKEVKSDTQLKDGNKYHREIIGFCGTKVTVDIYRVLDAYKTGSAELDHAAKKVLCAGVRGHKDLLTDIDNAIESLQAARLLYIQKQAIIERDLK